MATDSDLEARLGVEDLDPARINPEGIDEYMKRGQWFVWDPNSHKGPRSPHHPHRNHRGGFNALDKAADFETALEVAEREGMGISYPMSNRDPENPASNTEIYAIDIDIADEAGDAEGGAWVPDLNRLGDAVAEYSPSGNLRVYLRDVEIPEWYDGGQFTTGDADRPELGLYDDEKHVTVTGDVIGGLEPPVGTCNEFAFEQWLKEAWYGYHDEVLDAEVNVGDDEPWVTDDGRTDATESGSGSGADGDFDFDDIKVTDLSFVTGSPGERFAHPVHGSTNGNNFIIDDDDLTWHCWRDGHNCTGNALQLLAIEEGIVDCGGLASMGSDEWAETFDAARDRGLDVPEKKSSGTPAAPTPSDGSGADASPGSLSPTAHGHIMEGPDGYYHFSGHDDETGAELYEDRVTTFTLTLHSRLSLPNGEDQFEIEVDPVGAESYTETVDESVFNTPSRFKDHLAHKASAAILASKEAPIVTKLGLVVAGQEAPSRKGAPAVGVYDFDELVTPEGSLTADGWADDPDYVYCGEEGKATEAVSISPEDGDGIDKESVRETLRLLPQTRSKDRFLPAMGWFYTAPLRPVMDRINGEFNGLNITGDTGAGKSSTLDVMNELFGVGDAGYRLSDSEASYKYSVSQSRLPVVYDEYKPNEKSDVKVDAFKEVYRSVSRANSMNISTVTNTGVTNVGLTPKCAIATSGEQPMTGAAEERRSIATTFIKHAEDSSEAEAYARLTGEDLNEFEFDGYDLSKHALAYYQWVLDLDFEAVEEQWYDCNSFVVDVLGDLDASLSPTERRGLTTVAFGVTIYREFAMEMGLGEGDIPVSKADLRSAMEYLVDEGGDDGYTSHVEELCKLAGNAIDSGYMIEGDHYKIVNGGKEKEYVAIARGNHAFAKIKKYVRDHNVDCDLLGGFDDYSARIRDEEPDDPDYTDDDTVVYEASTNAGIGKRAFAVNPDAVWPESTDEDADTEASLREKLDASDTGYVDLHEVAVVDCDSVEQIDFFDYAGEMVVGDEQVDFIVLDGKSFEPIEGHTYNFENAKLEDDDGVISVKIKRTTTAREVGTARGDGQSGLDAAADGGTTPDDDADADDDTPPKREEENAVYEVLEDEYDGSPIPAGSLAAAVADRHDIAPERVKTLLDGMENRPDPRVMSAGGNKYEPV